MIRVLRVPEYTYRDEQAQLRDRMHWTEHVKLEDMEMQSAVVSMNFEEATDV